MNLPQDRASSVTTVNHFSSIALRVTYGSRLPPNRKCHLSSGVAEVIQLHCKFLTQTEDSGEKDKFYRKEETIVG